MRTRIAQTRRYFVMFERFVFRCLLFRASVVRMIKIKKHGKRAENISDENRRKVSVD